MNLAVRDGWTNEELTRVGFDLAQVFPLARPVVSDEVSWGGTQAEADKLLVAIHHNAECQMMGAEDCCNEPVGYEFDGPSSCPAHSLLDSQSSLDHLLNVYRNREWYQDSELGLEAELGP